MKKLLILCSHFGTPHTIKQFGANYKNKKIKIIVFSILPLLSPKVFKSFYNKENDIRINHKNFIYIKSYPELIKILFKLSKKSFFQNDANSSLTSSLIELFLINFKKFKKIKIVGEISPDTKNEYLKEVSYLYKIDKVLLIKKLFLFFFNKLYRAILNIINFNKPFIIFTDNKKYYDIFKKKYHLNIYKFDNENYSHYLKHSQKKNKKKYIVFLDQDLDHNFEHSLRKVKISKFNPKIYWKKMNIFFSELEKYYKYKYKIVIAAHHRRPKGDYPIKRKFIHNNTGDLVKNSIMVLGHHSLSINYAIFYKKPILLLNTKIFDLHTFTRKNSINILRKKLGLKVMNIDNKIKFKKNFLNQILLIDKRKYMNYFNKYLGFSFGQTEGEKWAVISKVLAKNNKE